ncbi:peroxisomal leader peptide-processing protease-like [Glandiceps talaboti]
MSSFSANCLVELTFDGHHRVGDHRDFNPNQRTNPLVLSKTPHRANTTKVEKFSCSGVVIDPVQGLVLTHGSLFTRFFSKPMNLRVQRHLGMDFVPLSGKESKVHKVDALLSKRTSSPASSTGNERGNFQLFSASPIVMWNCPNFSKVLNALLPKSDGWRFDDAHLDDLSVAMAADGEENNYLNYDEQAIQPHQSKSETSLQSQMIITSWFALLQIKNWNSADVRIEPYEMIPCSELQQGQSLVTVATPFASVCPLVFFNSFSKGIVTNIARENNSLIMTDARCLPGTEGGGVYTMENPLQPGYLAGLIVAPLCWKSNEWIGLTLACSISEILNSLQQVLNHRFDNLLPIRNVSEKGRCINTQQESMTIPYGMGIIKAMKRVVLVQAGSVWGSGVIIDSDKGIILTCRHVVKGAINSKVQVRIDFPLRHWESAEVIFCTSVTSALDLAVLRLQNTHSTGINSLPDLEIATDYRKGKDVCVVGHALFPREMSMHPSITYGVLSNLVTVEETPILLQSTCAVHSGASGGPLLCADTGKLLGIVASNSKDTESGASFPHVNFIIPIAAIHTAIHTFLKTYDVKCLQILSMANKDVQRVWKLQDDILRREAGNPQCRL